MITVEYVRLMARYNRWQNSSLVAAASTLTDKERWQDKGAFFGSIAATLNHVLWDDRVWLARQQGDRREEARISAMHPYTEEPRDWRVYTKERAAFDQAIIDWADTLSEATLAKPVSWTRGGTEVQTPFAFNVVHMFNHQTHHRGQVHAMLTASGVQPEPTDLQMLKSNL